MGVVKDARKRLGEVGVGVAVEEGEGERVLAAEAGRTRPIPEAIRSSPSTSLAISSSLPRTTSLISTRSITSPR